MQIFLRFNQKIKIDKNFKTFKQKLIRLVMISTIFFYLVFYLFLFELKQK